MLGEVDLIQLFMIMNVRDLWLIFSCYFCFICKKEKRLQRYNQDIV